MVGRLQWRGARGSGRQNRKTMTAGDKESYPLVEGGFREIGRVAWPIILSTASFTLMQFCDRLFLSRYSLTAIQAALPAGILAFAFLSGFLAVCGYTSTFVAHYFGAGQPARCSRATAQGMIMALIAWPILLLLIPLGGWLIGCAGHAPEVAQQERVYFSIVMLGAVGPLLNAALAGFFTGRGATRVTMLTDMTANAINVVLDYGLIYGRLGLPEMGIRGAALATLVAGLVGPLLLAMVYFSPPLARRYDTRRDFSYDAWLFRRMLKFGLPAGVQLFLDIASFEVFVMLTGRIGGTALAASNIALSINLVAFMPLLGLGMTAAILVGKYLGARRPEIASAVVSRTLILGLGYMVVIGCAFVAFPDRWYGFFLAESSAQEARAILAVGRWLLVIMALWGLADCANLVLGGALKGAGDTRFVMLYSILAAWVVLVPGQVVIVLLLRGGIILSWSWTALYILLLAVGYWMRFASGKWKRIDVLGRHLPLEPTRPAAEALTSTD